MSLFTLVSPSGLVAMISELGATLVELQVPDRGGRRIDVVLGFDRLERYLEDGHYFGCVVGRVANRIAGARFTLDGARARALAQPRAPSSARRDRRVLARSLAR